MARDEAPPFGRGETYFNGGTPNASDGANLEGKTYVFEDLDYASTGQGAKPARSNRYVTCMCVRNVAAVALLPKYLATAKVSGVNQLGQVDGKARTTAQRVMGVVDEFLPAAGVAVNDLFWLTIDGPSLCKTDLAAGANNVIAEGGALVALTAATSGATTAGRVAPQDLTGATQLLADQVQNRVGYALSAKTTAQTNGDVLVDVGVF